MENTTTVKAPYQDHHGYARLLRPSENTVQKLPSAATPRHSHDHKNGDYQNDKKNCAVTAAPSSTRQEQITAVVNQKNMSLTSSATAPAIPVTVAPTATVSTDRDDASRTRRVFAHLENLCTTDAARASLRQWQAAYAHRMVTDGGGGRKEKKAEALSTERKRERHADFGVGR
ncbi:hypothetical protein VTH06DRAFT_7206 [Thermothelomyces fergusii]